MGNDTWVLPAGYDASMFTVSLPRNYRNQQIADFARVAGLPGIYMANQLDAGVLQEPSGPHHYTNFKDHLQTKVHPLLPCPGMITSASCYHSTMGTSRQWVCSKCEQSACLARSASGLPSRQAFLEKTTN